jgi:hypothetical protein
MKILLTSKIFYCRLLSIGNASLLEIMSRTKLTVRNEVVEALILEAVRLGANTPEIMEVRQSLLDLKSAAKTIKGSSDKTTKVKKNDQAVLDVLKQFNIVNLTEKDVKVATVLQRGYKKNDETVVRYTAKVVYKPASFKEGVEQAWITLKTPMKTSEAAWNLIESTLKDLDSKKIPVA